MDKFIFAALVACVAGGALAQTSEVPTEQRRSLFIAALVALFFPALALAGGAVNLDKSGVALKGYDPVGYFTQKQPVKGRADLRVEHGGATYLFASPDHRAAFEAEPSKYVPAYGGYCAYGVAQGAKADIDPAAFTVVDGRLYMNLDADIQKRWRRDIRDSSRRRMPTGRRSRANDAVSFFTRPRWVASSTGTGGTTMASLSSRLKTTMATAVVTAAALAGCATSGAGGYSSGPTCSPAACSAKCGPRCGAKCGAKCKAK